MLPLVEYAEYPATFFARTRYWYWVFAEMPLSV